MGTDIFNKMAKVFFDQDCSLVEINPLVIDSTGKWLLAENQDSSNIVTFRIDQQSGRLEPTGQVTEVGTPVCLIFGPS